MYLCGHKPVFGSDGLKPGILVPLVPASAILQTWWDSWTLWHLQQVRERTTVLGHPQPSSFGSRLKQSFSVRLKFLHFLWDANQAVALMLRLLHGTSQLPFSLSSVCRLHVLSRCQCAIYYSWELQYILYICSGVTGSFPAPTSSG